MIEPFEGVAPEIAQQSYIHPTAVVIGDVALGKAVSIWPCAVLRGDTEKIFIGDESNIQDHCTLHTSCGFPLTVGRRVTVGHGVTLHGCLIGDECLIGSGAIVLDGAVVENGAIVGAGTLVPPGARVRAGMVVMGSPAKEVRSVRAEETDANVRAALDYWERAKSYARPGGLP